MPRFTTVQDLGSQYSDYVAGTDAFRPIANTTYPIGALVQLAPMDAQIFPDVKTVQIPAATIALPKILGVVNASWPGFNGAGLPQTFTSPTDMTLVRGTQGIDVLQWGYHPAVLLDTVGGVTVTDGIPLVTSSDAAGYAQGVAQSTAETGRVVVGFAVLPASGFASSLTHAALAQATIDFTVATPAAGDIVNTTIQSPYLSSKPGSAQTTTWSYKLTTADAVSATTAALGILTFLNAQPSFAQYFIATQTAGAVHVGVNTLANPFRVNGGTAPNIWSFNISISGMMANTLTTVGSVTGGGGTTYSAASGTFNGGTAGTGYKGTVPAWITVL